MTENRDLQPQEHTSLGTQGYRFIVVGLVSAIPDIGITFLLQFWAGFTEGWARTFGFIVGTLVAYMMNRRWTFNAEASTTRFVQVWVLYLLSYVVNIALYKYCFILGFDVLGWNQFLVGIGAFVIAQGTAAVINFFAQRWWIFKSV